MYSFGSQMFATGEGSNFTLTIYERKIPTKKQSPGPCVLPDGVTNDTHRCIEDDEFAVVDFSSAQATAQNGIEFSCSCCLLSLSLTSPCITGVLYLVYTVYPNPSGGPTTIFRDTNSVYFSSWTLQRPLPVNHLDRRYASIDVPELYEQSTQGILMHDVFSVTVTQPTPLYIAIQGLIDWPAGPYVYLTSHYQDWTYRKALASMQHFDYAMFAHSTSRMTCDGPSGVEDFHCFRKICDYEPADCYFYWPVAPIADPNPFYPRAAFTVYSAKWNQISWIEGQDLMPRPGHYSAALLLSYQVEVTDVPTLRLGGEWDRLSSCKMKFQGNLVNKDGELIDHQLINSGLSFVPEEPVAVEPLHDISDRIDVYLSKLNDLSGMELVNTQLQIDLYDCLAPFFSPSITIAAW